MVYQKLHMCGYCTNWYIYIQDTRGHSKARGQGHNFGAEDKAMNDAAHTSNIVHSDCHTAAQSTAHELHRA